MRTPILALVFGVVFVACGDDEKGTTDAATTDTGGGDTSTQDTTEPDTATPDTMVPDSATPDTAPPDTNEPDTSEPEVTEETCGCSGGASCLQAHDAQSCALLSGTCGTPQERVDACSEDDLMASCERSATTQYLYFARIDDWLVSAKTSCDSDLTGSSGTWTVTPIPEAVGDVCSCQRTAAACVQVYGADCDALSCDTGLLDSECAADKRVPGRCVTRDGERELFFYEPGADLESAQFSCLGASATEYYWYPDGIFD